MKKRIIALAELWSRMDSDVPNSYRLGFAIDHALQLLRALFTFGTSNGSARLFFRGANCRLLCRSRIRIGKRVRIGRHVLIDGLSRHGIEIGDGAKIGDYCRLIGSGTLSNLGSHIRIGRGVGIGEFSRIGGSGGVEIGDHTIIGQYFSAHPENHNFGNKEILIKDQGTSRAQISVGKNCWVGAKVTILAGSSIGHSCVIAAGSVVRGEFPPYSVIGGVPARVLKDY